MKEQLSLLIELQKTESEINKLRARCRSLPEEISKLEESFQKFEAGVKEDRAKLEDVQKVHREAEIRLRKEQETQRKAKDRLSEVKTNKEYQAILKEIEVAEQRNSETEDEIITLLEAVDKAKEEFKIKEQESEGYKQNYENSKKKLETELHSLDGLLSSCRQRSEELKTGISSELLEKYEAVKALHNTVAVTAVWKEVCGGCYMNIPPQLYIELQKSDALHLCPNCNRILYWYDQNGQKDKDKGADS